MLILVLLYIALALSMGIGFLSLSRRIDKLPTRQDLNSAIATAVAKFEKFRDDVATQVASLQAKIAAGAVAEDFQPEVDALTKLSTEEATADSGLQPAPQAPAAPAPPKVG